MLVKDSVFLVTGAAAGLGEATAIRLLENGAKVFGIDLKPLTENKFGTFGENFTFLKADITSEKDILNTLEMLNLKYGKLDGVVNCAGVLDFAPIYDFTTDTPVSLDRINKVIQVNLIGTMNVVRLAVGLLKDNKANQDGERGVIINTTSISACDGAQTLCAYVASKAGLNGLTLNLARDLANKGIRVISIAPGLYDTPMTKPFQDAYSSNSSGYFVFPKSSADPKTYAIMVISAIQNIMLNGSIIRLDGAQRLGIQVE